MRFPAPDVGVARFPGPDSRTVRFPGQGVGSVVFPPSPPPTVFIGSESVLEFVASTTAVNSPFYVAESVLDLVSVPSVSVSVAVLTASVLDITSAAQPIFDVVTSESVLDVVSSAQQSAVAVIVSGSVLDFVPTSTLSPVGAVSSTSTLDLLSEVTVFPGVPAVGASVLDFNPSAIQTPIVAVTSQSVLDITSEGTVAASFVPSGMTKTSNYSGSAANSTYKTVPGWTADAGSTVSSNGLVANSSKVGATLAATIVSSTSFAGATVTLRLQVNGVTVATGATSTYSSGSWNTVPSVSTTRDITAGDVVVVQWSCTPSENWLTAVAAGTSVRIT